VRVLWRKTFLTSRWPTLRERESNGARGAGDQVPGAVGQQGAYSSSIITLDTSDGVTKLCGHVKVREWRMCRIYIAKGIIIMRNTKVRRGSEITMN
jgi:hypothetical protein